MHTNRGGMKGGWRYAPAAQHRSPLAGGAPVSNNAPVNLEPHAVDCIIVIITILPDIGIVFQKIL